MRFAPLVRRAAEILLALLFVVAPVAGQNAFDKDTFLARQKWYLTFTLSLKGTGETTREDKQGGYDKLEWKIDREVSGVVELGQPVAGQFPGRHIPRDPAALMAAISEQGRYIAWNVTSPKKLPGTDPAALLRGSMPLGGHPLLLPVTYVVNDTMQSEAVSYGEAHSSLQESGSTHIQGTGTAFMSNGVMLACDLREMMFELDVEGARAAAGFQGDGSSHVTTQQESHSLEESLGESEDHLIPEKTAKADGFLPGMTETLRDKVGWQKLELRNDRIAFTVSEPVTKFPFGFTRVKNGGPPLELTMDVVLTPSPPSHAKLILVPRGYATWRPLCSSSETMKGNDLQIDWRVEEEDGDPANPLEAIRVKFALEGTSREPGVCLNYPLHPKSPADFDLKFASKTVSSGYAVGSGGQTLILSQTQVTARRGTITVECFDSGAWADLSVTAELADGRTLTGHLESDPSGVTIPLPKRAGNSRIAEGWRTAHGITGPDTEDDEKLPSAGKSPGDGFTYYEEYRGFMEGGKFVEGDPKKIDFFVRNYIGGDARPGVDLFERLTGAKIHDHLTDQEFDPGKRVLNANHQRGPHQKDQHGVFLRTEAGLNGAAARFTSNKFRGRPALCLGIFVQPRNAQTSTSTSENVPVSDQIFLYDQFIAHELLHSVGVEHHGDRDYRLQPCLIFSDSPINPSGKAHFEVSGRTVIITDETTGRDLAAKLEPDLLLIREKFRPVVARFMDPGSPEIFEVALNLFLGMFDWYVGAQGGECSGVEGCVTRYYFAKLYEKQGVSNAYYYIGDKHTERAGLSLCRSLVGTGINAVHKPQSRYGNAEQGFADCADWIVFNDAAPRDQAPVPSKHK